MKRAMKKKQKTRAKKPEYVFQFQPLADGRTDLSRFLEGAFDALQITAVSYGETFNTGNYTSRRLDATATVPPGSTPTETLTRLRKFIREKSAEMDLLGLSYTDEQLEKAKRIVQAAELKEKTDASA